MRRRSFRGWTPTRSVVAVDVATAVIFAVVVLVELATHIDDGYRHGPASWNLPLLLGTVAALALRRTWTALAVCLGYAFVLVPSLFIAHTIFFFGTLLPLLLLTYTATRRLPARDAVVAALAPALVLAIVPIHQPGFDAGDYVFWATLAAIAIGLGTAMRRLDQHRATLASALAEQIRDQDVRERSLLLDERTRIARELHDVVAHAVSLMVVQAGAARLAVGLDDDEARQGLLAVENAGRNALLDLRRLLAVLRPDDEDTDITPAPGLAMLDELLDRTRTAGITVASHIVGDAWELPVGLDLCAYRIIQESLTNTLKHAGPTRVDVTITFGRDEVELDIVDAGPVDQAGDSRPRRTANAAGHGLIGMRERATVFGGSLEARPHADGWRVRAVLPRSVSDRAHVPAATS